ncbi:MAG: carbohydrate kinase family protein, partial [Thauera sp.]
MSILVCGSVAYDSIMVFHDRFKNHILPEQIHILNVSFLVPDLRREFGGCAGNIAYGLKLLGSDPLIVATVGEDAGPY